MDLDLGSRVVLVSGGSAGIGRATVAALVAEGARVSTFARDARRLTAAHTGLAVDDDQLLLHAGDAGNADDVHRIVDDTLAHFGRIDGVVVNAGVGVAGDVHAPSSVWAEQLHTKVIQATLLVEATVESLRSAPDAAIVLVNGVSAHHPDARMASSSAGRAALASYATSLSTSLACDGVRVVTVNVGAIDTDRQRQKFASSNSALTYAQWVARQAEERGIPLGRFGDAAEVASTIVFLLSRRSSYTTGTSIDVAGGLGARM